MADSEPLGYPVGLVGESHYQKAIRRCSVGDCVHLFLEPTNPYDPLAIAVETEAGATIGYIPRNSFLQRVIHEEENGCSARILNLVRDDAGLSHVGVVIDIEIDDTPLNERPHRPD